MTFDRTPVVLRLGGFFFRWRSYLPVALLPIIALGIAKVQYHFGSPRADLRWEIACVVLALAGLAIRVYTVGIAAPGTSGRNTRHLKAAALNTTGPYSVIRHPIYLGNFLIALGLSLFPHTWIAPLVWILTAGYYACMARWEEEFLRDRFGETFERWAARVPAFMPRPSRYLPVTRPFDWRRALRQEFNTLALILMAPLLFELAEDFWATGQWTFDSLWTPSAIFGGTFFVVLRFLKKRTVILRNPV